MNMPWLIWVAWIVIAVVLLWLVWMLIRAFLNRELKGAKQSESLSDDEPAPGDLPLDALPKAPPPRGGLLDEARRLYEQQRYSEAIVYLFSYELLRLDQNQCIRFAHGKTNREYMRELVGRPDLYAILAHTLIPFEDAFFGGHELSREQFETAWNQVDPFNRAIERK